MQSAALRTLHSAAMAGLTATVLGASTLSAQEAKVVFESELPRTLVFIAEEGSGENVASLGMTEFLRAAGFPMVDPALAHTAAQRELVQRALQGDEGAAVDLGRDFGAQVIILGTADWGARPDPVDGTLVTATADVNIRALRLDEGNVVASAAGDARDIDATEQRARTKAIRKATGQILEQSSLLGQLMNNWTEQPWEETAYWRPDPGSLPAQFQQTTATAPSAGQGTPPGLAIILADVRPSSAGGATRGFGVVKKGDAGSSSVFNPIRLEGIVTGETRGVKVDGKLANLEPLSAAEATRYGVQGQQAQKFWFETNLPISKDTVSVVAEGPGGATSTAVAAPRIDKRWAVIIGVGDYASDGIPDLEFANADATAVYDFITSDEAGPFEKENVLFLSNEEATGARMREALFVFLQQADWDDLVFIYYAGHGAPDPARPDNLYLLPHDADLNALGATGFPMWDVKTALRRQIAAERVIVVADACHSAGTADGDAVGGGENPVNGSFEQLFAPSRRLMMTAADTNEFSLEDARWGGHGVFTHFMLEALHGNGDTDANGIVTFNEVFDYVSSNVAKATQGRQNPQRSGFGDIPLAVVSESADRQQRQGPQRPVRDRR